MMLKDWIEFMASYPLWVKVTVILLFASAFLILVAFRPSATSTSVPDASFRIERIDSSQDLELISLVVNVNGRDYRYPSAYEFATYERNMFGGEYVLPADVKEYLISIRVVGKFSEDRRLFPTLPPNVVPVSLDFQPRQPIRISKNRLPVRGDDTLRLVQMGIQRAPREYNIRIHYVAQ